MSRQELNQSLLQTSFLYGANAGYIEDLYARFEKDPASVDAEWRDFFGALNDDPATVAKNARGASWEKPNWPVEPRNDLISALDGNWGQVEKVVGEKLKAKSQEKGVEVSAADVQRATRDSVRALMMIRAYRMRGHLHANLDPLGLAPPKDHEELHPSSYGFGPEDYDRKIFLDHVLGLDFATIPEMIEILRRTYCDTIGFEFMHMSDPAEKSWMQERIEGPGKTIAFTREGKRAILTKLVEAEGFERFCDLRFTERPAPT